MSKDTPQNLLEIRLSEDADGHQLSLKNISIGNALVLKSILQSVTDLINSNYANGNFKISLIEGSQQVLVNSEDKEEREKFTKDLNSVLDRTTKNKSLVKPYREIQKTLKDSRPRFTAKYIGDRNLAAEFISEKNFSASNKPRKFKHIIGFHKGKLTTLGGKALNAHIEITPKLDYIFNCSDEQAEELGLFFRKTVYFMSLDKISGKDIISKTLLIRMNEKEWNLMKDFHAQLENSSTLDKYELIYNLFEAFSNGNDITNSKILEQYFAPQVWDIGILKTYTLAAQIISELEESRKAVMEVIEEYLGKSNHPKKSSY